MPPLLDELPGGAFFAAVCRALPALTERVYQLVARNRSRLASDRSGLARRGEGGCNAIGQEAMARSRVTEHQRLARVWRAELLAAAELVTRQIER